MATGPTDDDLEAIVRAAPASRWSELATAAGEVGTAAEETSWGGGDRRVEVIDGVEREVISMPYAVYGPRLERLMSAVTAITGVVPFAWPDWDGIERYQGGRGLVHAPVADAVRMVTVIVRSERFSEGSIGAALADGTLMAVVARLLAWHDAQPS